MKRDFDNYFDPVPTMMRNSQKEYNADRDDVTAEQQARYEALLNKNAAAGRVIAVVFAVLNGIAAIAGLLAGSFMMFLLEALGAAIIVSKTTPARWIFLVSNIFGAVLCILNESIVIIMLYNIVSAVMVIFEKHLDAYFKCERSYKNR